MKKLIAIILFMISNLIFCQQFDELRLIKHKYDLKIDSLRAKSVRKKKIELAEKQRNEEYFYALQRYKEKNLELPDSNVSENKDKMEAVEFERMAELPGGINAFRSEFANVFYSDGVKQRSNKQLQCIITFIVERDGSLTNVKATSENESFAQQAVLAVYVTDRKWNPAIINGQPVRTRFKMPLKMNFE